MRGKYNSVAESVLKNIDWKGIPQRDIDQISYEVKHWANDYEQLRETQILLSIPVEPPFEETFLKWIPGRIQMVLNRI